MKKLLYKRLAILLLLIGAINFTYVYASNLEQTEQGEDTASNIVEQYKENKESVAATTKVSETPDELKQLYALSACLMDADNGRVLFEKNGYEKKAMASTTKIMTCIVTLENAQFDDIVTISKNAARQPDVQLNAREGEQYYLKDLLYSLMLESHNDVAVAIAEHVGGSVNGFAERMNQKAKEIGCKDTYFITPNGLDASDGNGKHSTTATNLARIMSYCIKESPKKEEFLEITRTPSRTFSDLEKRRSFSCNNHNAFLGMMDGALSGKTGFTGDAGFCYVGALERDGKTFIVALLACGWPNNKRYKWSDTKKLMQYGLTNYKYKSFDSIELDKSKLNSIIVAGGQTDRIGQIARIGLMINEDNYSEIEKEEGLLLREDEKIEVIYNVPSGLVAPVEADQIVGTIDYLVNGELWKQDKIVTDGMVDKIDYYWCLGQVFDLLLLQRIEKDR